MTSCSSPASFQHEKWSPTLTCSLTRRLSAFEHLFYNLRLAEDGMITLYLDRRLR